MARKYKKNANGEGSVFQRKDGYWVAQHAVPSNGAIKYRQYYGKTQKAAIEKRDEARAKESAGLPFDAGRASVGEYLDRWLLESVKDSVKCSTYEGYSDLTRRHVIPAFRRTKLNNLTTDQVRNFRRSKLDEGLSPRTVQHLLFLLRKALQQAVEDGLIPCNVTHGVKVSQADKEEIKPLTPEQAKGFLEAARGDRIEALYVLAVTTGLRQGELLGLKWEDIDLGARTLSVKRTLSGPRRVVPYLARRRPQRAVGRSPSPAGPWRPLNAIGQHKAKNGRGSGLCGTIPDSCSAQQPVRR